MIVVQIRKLAKEMITEFFSENWGSPQMVISSGIFQCDELDGFAVLDENNRIIGLITYIMDQCECEIISLDSLVENKGIGSKLIQEVENIAKKNNVSKIKLVTTNDNVHALAFYQKRGYQLAELLVDAVDLARKMKPEIPLVADNGIPIRDELVLIKWLDLIHHNEKVE
ncbi:GNAT family N-acetyltransferase [Heyndrickxia sp. FSL K6-6286]|uniref:GNAT family N-acetyltransferase n=1 Tax=Heyndrickxia sp. FSL K6-6286 TaxID=2921510 RepID=UPI00315B07B7